MLYRAQFRLGSLILLILLVSSSAYALDASRNVFIDHELDVSISERFINVLLQGYYKTDGVLIYFMTRTVAPDESEIRKIKASMELEKDVGCGLLVVWIENQGDGRIREYPLEGCEEAHGLPVEEMKLKIEGLGGNFHNDFFLWLLREYRKTFVGGGGTITSFGVAVEDCDGKPCSGLTANEGNYLGIDVTYPTKKASRKTRIVPGKRFGSVIMPSSGCEIRYFLETKSVGTFPESHVGRISIIDSSVKQAGHLSLNYHPPISVFPRGVLEEELFISFKCGSKSKEEKVSIRVEQPVVVVLPGLWHKAQKEYQETLDAIADAGFTVYPYWYPDLTGDIKLSAAELRDVVEAGIVEQAGKGVKLGKVYLVGHSMGGLIVTYYVANNDGALGGIDRVSRVVALGTPFRGAGIVRVFAESCKEGFVDLNDPDCRDLDAMMRGLRKVGHMGDSGALTLGTGLLQMNPESKFYKSELGIVHGSSIEYFVFAGTNHLTQPEIWNKYGAAAQYVKVIPYYYENLFRFFIEKPVRAVVGDERVDSGVEFLTAKVKLAFITARLWAQAELDIPLSMYFTFDKLVSVSLFEGTDATVERLSALDMGEGKKVLLGHKRIGQFPLNHGQLFRSKLARKIIPAALYGNIPKGTTTIVSTESPVNLYVYDRFGNVVGMKDGSVREDIPGSTFFLDEGHIQTAFIEDDEAYTYVIEAIEEGTFSFTANLAHSETNLVLSYTDVPVVVGSVATVSLSSDSENYRMGLDSDGDGTVDRYIEPDFVDRTEFEVKAEDYSEFTVIVDIPEEKSFTWAWMILGGIGVLLAGMFVGLHFRRGNV